MHNQFRFSKDYLVKLLSALFIMAGSVYASLEYELIYGEKGSNKIKLFIFAEGYADYMKDDYENNVKYVIDTLFSISPYKEYKNLFNVYRVWTPSHLSTVPSKESDNTFFGGYTSTGGPRLSDRGMQYFENILTEQKDSNFLCDEFVWNQQSIVLYNIYATSGITGVSYMQNNLTLLYWTGGGEGLAHELGHQIARLGDEYEKAGYEVYDWPETANTTKKTTLDSIPWRYWIKSTTPVPTPETAEYTNVIGLFEGAQYNATGWYRPSQSCMMRVSTIYTFCNVCREALTSSILKYTHFTKSREFLSVMVDSVSPRMKTTVTSGTIMVTYAQIDTFPVKLRWRFNDSLLSDTSCILDLSAFKKNGTIKAIIEGNSGFIKTPSYMPKDTIQWTFMYNNTPVKTTPDMVSNTMIRQIRNGVYYIPQSAYGTFHITDILGRNVPIRASEKFADHMIVDLNKYAAKGKYLLVYGNKD